jgi:hypothetical protein
VIKILFLFVFVFVYGCADTALQSSSLWQEKDVGSQLMLHEEDESKLLTKAEFMEKVALSAAMIYEGLRAINDAGEQYAIDNDVRLPQGRDSVVRSMLLDGGYLNAWPVVPAFAFTDLHEHNHDFVYSPKLDDMDGSGARDDVILVQDLKLEVCEEFSRSYSDFKPDVIIHDFEAEEKYPAEVYGRHIKVFAIIYAKTQEPDYCEIEWVVKYNEPPRPRLGT